MSTETNTGEGRMKKINVRVPGPLDNEIDKVWEERGYSSKSEFIRDALRDAVNPAPRLSEEALQHLEESREQREQDETMSHDELKERLGLDD